MTTAIITDIEGTTTAISFVHQVLFPYAKTNLPSFVQQNQHDPAIQKLLADTRSLAKVGPDAPAVPILLQWIEQDKKATPLKALQGHIWEAGYHHGSLKGHLYQDAFEGLRKWHQQGISLYVYSSGSVYAQKLLFGFSEFGDLTPMFSGYFDTNIGHKKESQSYRNIQEKIAIAPRDILFLSDVGAELDAAAQIGIQTIQLVRDETITPATNHRQIASFDEISL